MGTTLRLRRTALFLSCLCASAMLVAQKPLPADRSGGAGAVTVDQTKAWLGHLAGPELAGRGTGQPGYRLAADYVRDHFAKLGLEPGADGSWFQDMPWTAREPKIDATKVTFRLGDKVVEIPGTRLAGSVSSEIAATGAVAILTTTESTELEDVDLEGRIVVVALPKEPQEQNPRGRGRNRQFQVTRALQGKKAAAVLMAQTEPVTSGLQGSSGPGRGNNPAARGRGRMPTTLSFGGQDLKALFDLAGLPENTEAGVHLLAVQAEIAAPIEEKQAPACNVVGILRGSDPVLKNEYVVIGSHLDHLGRRGDTIFPGADDDGSGTTGVLAVSQMFAKNTEKPRRSILFVCFCGEEMGLLGSRHFADNSPIPVESIVAELQMDMIGRDEEENAEGDKGEKAEDNRNTVHLIGTKQLAPALHELCMARNENAGLDIEWDQEGMFSRSDHANFARLGVPIAFFFTGLHRDYHQPSDTPDKIHYEKLLRIATWVYDVGFELGKQDGRPQIDPELWKNYDGKGRREPAAPLMPKKTPAKDDKDAEKGK
ncbi:MAG: M20/M25/M40 family metallo-hydrolase [Planctomycetota bacterium]